MITKEITLCNQQVTLGYCYATEIVYKELSGEDMLDYVKHTVECFQAEKDPDIKRTIFAIIACLTAYYQNDELPLKDADIMREAKPAEIGMAFLAILELRSQFYAVPKGEPKEKEPKGGKKRKNA